MTGYLKTFIFVLKEKISFDDMIDIGTIMVIEILNSILCLSN